MKEETEAIRFAETTRLGSYIEIGFDYEGRVRREAGWTRKRWLVWLNTIIKIKALISTEGVNAKLRDYGEVIVCSISANRRWRLRRKNGKRKVNICKLGLKQRIRNPIQNQRKQRKEAWIKNQSPIRKRMKGRHLSKNAQGRRRTWRAEVRENPKLLL